MRKQPNRPSLSHGRGPRGPRSTSTSRRQVEEAATPATPAVPVEQAARLAMPAVAPAEQHTPHLSGASNRHPPPRLAAWPARLRAPPQSTTATPCSKPPGYEWSKPPGLPCRRSRRQSNTQPTCPGSPNTIRHHQVEQAARLAMPAAAPAELHTPPVRGFQLPSAAKTGGVARKTARSTSTCRRQVEQAARLATPAVMPAVGGSDSPILRGALCPWATR